MRNYNNSRIYEYQMRKRMLRPSLVIIIKLAGLKEILLCQIKRMSTDDVIADLLMSSQKNHQSIEGIRRKYEKFYYTY